MRNFSLDLNGTAARQQGGASLRILELSVAKAHRKADQQA